MSQITFKKWYEGALGVLIFTMIVMPRLVGLGVVLFFAVWILGLIKKEVIVKFNLLSFSFFALYLMYLIGSFYTNHIDIANKYLEYKLTFALFPIFFLFQPKQEISLRIPATSLIISLLIVGLLGFINCVPLYLENNNYNFLMSAYYSYIHHPTYLSVFAGFGSMLLLKGWSDEWKFYTTKNVIAMFIFFVIIQIMCFSLAGFLFLLIHLMTLVLYWMYKKYSKTIVVSVILVGVFLMTLTIRFTPGINTQFVNSYDYMQEFFDDPEEFYRSKQTYVGGSETRLIMWSASYLVFLDHPFGVGTGNVDDFLTEKLNSIGQPHMADKKLNPHNQFLQTAIEIGVFGLMLLLFITFYGIYYAIKTRNWLLLFLIISLAFNSLFESMLQRQSGIVFYTFWIGLLCVSMNQIQNKTLK